MAAFRLPEIRSQKKASTRGGRDPTTYEPPYLDGTISLNGHTPPRASSHTPHSTLCPREQVALSAPSAPDTTTSHRDHSALSASPRPCGRRTPSGRPTARADRCPSHGVSVTPHGSTACHQVAGHQPATVGRARGDRDRAGPPPWAVDNDCLSDTRVGRPSTKMAPQKCPGGGHF
jgi:hypothetical protein